MNNPSFLSIPTLHAGNTANIIWTAVDGANAYQLDRKLNSDMDFMPVYSGPETSFIDFIPEDAATVTYRIQAAIEIDKTWDEIDGYNRTWDELDALDWMWLESSDFSVAETREVIPNRPPDISDQDRDLGIKEKGFDVVFNVIDPDPNNTVDIIVELDNITIFFMQNVQQGADYTANITDEQIFAMQKQSRHNVVITATDNKGAIATRTYIFTVVEDLITTAVFYILIDGRPVAKLMDIQQWTDYLSVGTHRYTIRGVDKYDNFSDSNSVTITISIDWATLALAGSPADYIELIVRRNERPQVSQNYTMLYTETQYEGREFPVYEHSGQQRNAMPIAFTTRTLDEQSALLALVAKGQPLVYRDLYNSRIIGVIPDLNNSYQGRFRQQTYNSFIDFNVTINQCDYNEVIGYD